ncbi:MAG: 16S rRNA (uracil(1498)-N(3))-methyltransferase, partial [Gemmataceae bacterium]|nr:16S rRNA (uracil(1498)-N(3))-methyltransferase [Gemmataceae bacterium]
MADRFYVSFPIAPGELLLQGPEAHHLATVRRFRPGDSVILFTGDGSEYPAEVLAVGKKDVTLRLGEPLRPVRELPGKLEVAAAVPKGDREEFLIEKLTELGVTRFVPLITARSVVVPKQERLQRTVIEASKQCGRNVLMEVAAPTRFADYLAGSTATERYLAHTGTGPDAKSPAELARAAGFDVTIAVGPEGGFTDEEFAQAVRSGWQPLHLGSRVLRIETAAVAAAGYVALSASTAC